MSSVSAVVGDLGSNNNNSATSGTGGSGGTTTSSNIGSNSTPNSSSTNQMLEKWLKNIELVQIPRSEVNRLIMNYLVTEGFKDAAEKFEIESGTEAGIDLNILDQRIKIIELIQMGEIKMAIELINYYQPTLLDDHRLIYFHLKQQQLIELIRNKDIDGALNFAQNNLTDQHYCYYMSNEYGSSSTTNGSLSNGIGGSSSSSNANGVLEEIERTLALLAFEDPETSPFGDLLALSHRQKVASELNTVFLSLNDYNNYYYGGGSIANLYNFNTTEGLMSITENNSTSVSKLAYLLKFILWAQEELDKKKVKYPKMTDIPTASIE